MKKFQILDTDKHLHKNSTKKLIIFLTSRMLNILFYKTSKDIQYVKCYFIHKIYLTNQKCQ